MNQALAPAHYRSAPKEKESVLLQRRGTQPKGKMGAWRSSSVCGGQQTDYEKAVKRILVATDFTPAGSKAIERGLAIAEQNDAALAILHVIDVNAKSSLGTAAELMKSLWKQGEDLMSQIASCLPKRVRLRTVLDEGLPWETVVEKSRDFDLLILGRSNSQHFWKFFSPQTSQRVLRNSVCPVMVLDEHSES